jgi:hypothetical protein
MSHLVPCPACSRHIWATEASCPFCAEKMSASFAATPTPVLPTSRLARAAMVVFSTTVAASATACGGSVERGTTGSTQPASMGGAAGMSHAGTGNGTAGMPMLGEGGQPVYGAAILPGEGGGGGMEPDTSVLPPYGISILPDDGNGGRSMTGEGTGGAGVEAGGASAETGGAGVGGAAVGGAEAGGESAVGGLSAVDPGAPQPMYGAPVPIYGLPPTPGEVQ